MPRRVTLSYSSEDAPDIETEKIYVYYCKYSRKHALSTTKNLNTAPRRRTDHAIIIDTDKEIIKLSNHISDGGVKLIKRRNGDIERQYRLNIAGKLPFAYRTELQGRYLYVLDNALTTRVDDDGTDPDNSSNNNDTERKPPVPPCITRTPQGSTRVVLDIYDRGNKNAIIKISADAVRVQIMHNINNSNAMESMMDTLQTVLGVRLSQMELLRGETPREKVLVIDGVDAERVFDKLQTAMQSSTKGRQEYRG